MGDAELISFINKVEMVAGFISEHQSLDETCDRIMKIKQVLERFDSLEKLVEHITFVEKYFYVEKKYFTIEETAHYLGVSKSKVYKMSSRNELPSHKRGAKLVFFAKEDIIQWIKGGTRMADNVKLEIEC